MKRLIPLLALASLAGSRAQAQTDRDQILNVEEQFRVAKLKNDTATLGRVLADDCQSINQYGAKRDKAQVIELWTTFTIQKLTTESADVRITGDTAVVTGKQTEINAT